MRTSYSPFAEVAEEADAFKGVDFRVHVAAADADFGLVVGEVSAMRLVKVVRRTRGSRSARSRISARRSSICPLTGRISNCGSMSAKSPMHSTSAVGVANTNPFGRRRTTGYPETGPLLLKAR
jgi:hypothetical protein